jgi:2-polyprenyl-6-methoxyphenol hydroxylase-like FAD-dependent oxidoreductase
MMTTTTSRATRRRAGQVCGTGHAVVLGGSMAGLAAASALTTRFDAVTIVDRDVLPDGHADRQGVPQGRHVHVLLTPGKAALERLFPGLVDGLAADGAVLADLAERGRMWVNGRQLALGPAGPADVSASRPFVEGHVRARVRDDATITILERHQATELVADRTRRRITGLRVADRAGVTPRTIGADLVVDCSGRGSRAPRWLSALGYASPPVDEVRVDLRYATRQYRLPADVLDGDLLAMVGPLADDPRAGWLSRVEGDRWTLTLAGMAGVRPPIDPDGFEAFAASLATPVLHRAIRSGDPLDEPVAFGYPASTRRRYDRVRDLPDGFLVAGDAVCSFNPIYGQGMTVAALEALALRSFLEQGQVPSARTWFRAITPLIDTPWDLAVGGDLAIDGIEGRRTAADRLLDRYMDRYFAAAEHDAVLGVRFARVTSLLEPPGRLLHPASVARVLTGNLRHRRLPTTRPDVP